MPEHPIEHKSYTDEERLAWRDSYLEMRASEGEGIDDPPDVPLVRWVNSLQEYDSALASCMTEQGFPARVYFGGGLEYTPGVPDSQRNALDRAWYICDAKYTPIPAIMTDWSDDQFGMLYDYWSEALVPCLESYGVPVSPAPVTRETFIASFHDVDWSPDHALVGAPLSEEEKYHVMEQCPQYPPAKYFYGS